jgi:hypothetical protein
MKATYAELSQKSHSPSIVISSQSLHRLKVSLSNNNQ